MDRNDLERQQIAGHAAREEPVGLFELIGAHAQQAVVRVAFGRRLRPWRPAERPRRRGPSRGMLNAACNSTASSAPPIDDGHDPLPAAGLHRDERAPGGEHHAEDQQHHRAADVDHQLHGAEEIGPRQEEQPGHRRQRHDQLAGHADDVAATTTATANAQAITANKQEEADCAS